MCNVVHCKKARFDIYIGRPSIWGNPYSWLSGTLAKFSCKNREDSLRLYRIHILNSPELLAKLPSLKNKVLGCWCAPLACHGDVLHMLIEELGL